MHFLAVVLLILTACDRFEQSSPATNNNLMESLSYGKDKYGICYAFAKDIYNDGIKFTTVPCDKVGL